MRRWLALMWWTGTGYRLAVLRAALGAFIAVALTVALCTLGEAAREAVSDALLGAGGQVRVRSPSLSLGPLDLTGGLVPDRAMSDETMAAFREVEGVENAWPEAWSRFPVGLKGNVLGQRMYSDGALLGVVADAVAEDSQEAWTWTPGDPVPVLAPRQLLAVYNGSFAPGNGLPRLKDRALLGLRFQIVAGRSSFGHSEVDPVTVDGRCVGVTSYGGALAGIVPLEVVAWMDEQLQVDNPGSYTSALLTLRAGADVQAVKDATQALGWQAEEVGGAARQVAVALKTIDAGVAIMGGILVAAALLLLAQVYGVLLRERTSDLRILRVLGTPRAVLGLALVGEVGGVSAVATAAGVSLGAALAALATGPVADLLSELLGMEPELSAAPPLELVVPLLLGAPVVAVLAVLPSVVRVLTGDVLQD